MILTLGLLKLIRSNSSLISLPALKKNGIYLNTYQANGKDIAWCNKALLINIIPLKIFSNSMAGGAYLKLEIYYRQYFTRANSIRQHVSAVTGVGANSPIYILHVVLQLEQLKATLRMYDSQGFLMLNLNGQKKSKYVLSCPICQMISIWMSFC